MIAEGLVGEEPVRTGGARRQVAPNQAGGPTGDTGRPGFVGGGTKQHLNSKLQRRLVT